MFIITSIYLLSIYYIPHALPKYLLILTSMQLSSYNYSHCTEEEFCRRSKTLNDLPKIAQPLKGREGNQVQICQAPKPVGFCLLVHAASYGGSVASGVWLSFIPKMEGTASLN